MVEYPLRWNTNAWGHTDLAGTNLDTSADFSPSFRVGYDVEEQRIYVAIETRDDRVGVTAGSYTDNDAGEVYLSGEPELRPLQYALCAPGGTWTHEGFNPNLFVRGRGSFDIERTESRAAYGRIGDLTTYEFALQPIGASLDDVLELRPGMTFGFDAVASDKDAPGDTGARIAWTVSDIPTGRGVDKSGGGKAIGRVALARGSGELGWIHLRVKLASGSPLSVGYELWQEGGETVTRVHTGVINRDGSARLPVPAGEYRVAITCRGYATSVVECDVTSGTQVDLNVAIEDDGTLWHVDDDRVAGGDGSAERPFATIQEALVATSYGDTVQLAPGT